ncbi:sugar transferase [Patescibacteria group bacterium]|nr:sugar transferase [Patescibacteria group bacterium]
MVIANKKEPLILFGGDIVFFILALWITLLVRYFEVPSSALFYNHLVPFSFLFVVWVLIFFIAGLYDKHTILFKGKLPNIILNAQIVNIILAATFFFFVPIFDIAPKTNLFIYLFISFGLIALWRLVLAPRVSIRKRARALIVGSGNEMKDLEYEVNNNTRYGLKFVDTIELSVEPATDLVNRIKESVRGNNVSVIVLDAKDGRIVPILPALYTLIFQNVRFVEMSRVYEDIFDRIPVTFVKENWLIDNVPLSSKLIYDVLKRLFDIIISLVGGLISLIVYPVVYILIKLDDRGSVFYISERIGKNGKHINIYKFRSMSENEEEHVTRVGEFLRKTRLDELPQLWSVLRGDLSLVGPRPEIPELASLYEEQIPYYNIRHLIKPGLSGWAQINDYNAPKRAQLEVEKTETKLSYDLYYVKNRSPLVDLQIALKTIKTLLSRTGL